uniref:Reverse transcriptase Ty1/copia-type domain-containing protein n=1 Tax=Tanacetum cinerariifolium TaxID=118510 RepID=A0A699H0E0_TANCI|nr:hypothetical protein [Tanacetum cinerariifolium]
MESQSETTQTVSALKLPVLKIVEYNLWSMRMNQYLTFTDHALWDVIVNGDSVSSASAKGPIPLKTAEQKLARKNKLKAKSTLMLAIIDEHLLKFYACKDAKSLWEAIKNRFGGNKESKKTQKTILKQNYKNFVASSQEGLDKTYDSINETLNIAHSVSAASLKNQASTASYADDVMFSFFFNQSNAPQLDNEDLEQIDTDDLEEINLKWQVAMLTMRGKRNRDAPTRNAPVDTSTTNALVVQDGICGYDWSFQAKEELTNFVLMAHTSQGSSCSSSLDSERKDFNKSNLEIIGYQMGLESLEAKIVVHEKNEAVYEEDIAFLKYDVQVKDISIKDLKNKLEDALKEKDDLKLKIKKFETSSKNLTKLINSQISTVDKTGLGYDGQMNESDVNESEVLNNVVDINTSKQSSYRAATLVSTATHANIAASRPHVNNALPTTYSHFKAHSLVRRPFNQKSAAKTNNFNEKVYTAKVNNVTTIGPKAVVSAAEGNRNNAAKSSTCWIWRPKRNLIDHISKDSGSYTLKRFNYIDPQGRLKHMTGNKSYHIDYQEIDGGFVTFGGNAKGGKITGKGIENQIDHKVKTIRCDNGTEFKNRIMNEFCEMKGNQTNSNVGTKANIDASQAGKKIVLGPQYVLLPLFTTDSQGLKSLEYEVADDARKKSTEVLRKENGVQDPAKEEEAANTNNTNRLNTVSLSVNAGSSSFTTIDPGRERTQMNEFESMFGQDKDANGNRMFTPVSAAGSTYVYLGGSIPINAATLPNADLPTDPLMPDLEDTVDLQDTRIFSGAYDNEVKGVKVDFNNLELTTVSAFMYGTIEEEVYVCQPPGFEDPHFPNKVYKVEKALYGLHQAPRARYETLSTYLLENGFRIGIIDKTLFIKKDKGLMHNKMSSMGELTFFLGLQVMQNDDGIFIIQDKYVADILKKFNFSLVKTTSTPKETNKALLKDEEAENVDVYLYISKIRDGISDEFGVKTGSCKVNTARRKLVLLGEKEINTNDPEHSMQPESINDTYLMEQGDTNITIDSLDMNTNREMVDQDDDDLAKEHDQLASLIDKLKYEIDDSKNHNKLLESSNKTLVNELISEIKDFKTKNKILQLVKGEGSGQPSEPQPPSLTTPPSDEEQVTTVGDEAIYTREDDRVVRATTTATSLEAERKSLDKENVSKQGRNLMTRIEEGNFDDDFDDMVDKAIENFKGDTINAATGVSATSASVTTDGMRTEKAKENGVVFCNMEESARPRTILPSIDPKDKGKEKAELERMQKDRSAQEEASNTALATEFDDLQEIIDADALLAAKLQEEEREQFFIDEQAKFLVEIIAERKRFFATQRAEQIRNKPPTKAQLKNKMITYLKNMVVKDNRKKDDSSQKQAKSTKKRPRSEHDEESVKKQKLEDDTKKEELRACLDIVPGDDFAINDESLATKYPIVDWKTQILTENIMYYQIIRANGSSKNYKILTEMCDDFDKKDMLDLYRLFKQRYETKSSKGYDILLWGDLITLFKPSEEDEYGKLNRTTT